MGPVGRHWSRMLQEIAACGNDKKRCLNQACKVTIQQNKMNKPLIIIGFIITALLIAGAGLYFWQKSKKEPKSPANSSSNELSEALSAAARQAEQAALENAQKQKNGLEKSENEYDIFGGSEFDTEVTGYLETREEEVFGENVNTAYFAITDFEDINFRKSIEAGIKEGNSVNKKSGNLYLFNLGCLKNFRIVGMDYGDEVPYLDDRTEKTILNSSKSSPVSLKLRFGLHPGAGCTCCNLAHSIRIME